MYITELEDKRKKEQTNSTQLLYKKHFNLQSLKSDLAGYVADIRICMNSWF